MSDSPRFPHEKALALANALDRAVFKVLFDRPKDWLDVESIVRTRGERFDAAYVERWVDAVAGADDPRTSRLRALLRDRG